MEIQDIAKRLGLARHPVWLKLLHYENSGRYSAVLPGDFFLSSNGRRDPEAELSATISAYFSPWDENYNAHARCRFPARYYWLSQQLPLPGYNLKEGKCQNFENWALLDSVKSISVLLVSGYFGNPASTFGHAFLKFNTDSVDDRLGLFDLTLSYGALVPENEYVLRYAVRGLLGGYEAGFSDKYFYTHDLVYSRTEFRDMWDYKLGLTDYERTLLILHIWEIAGKKFTYYFLDKNCAYRLAELMGLVIEENLLSNSRFWYAPVELFYRLNDIDKARQESSGKKLIGSVRFIPSSQRSLYCQLKLLTRHELDAFNAIIRGGINSMPTHLSKLTTDRQILVLDSLLAYQQYRLIADGSESSPSRREAKDKILLARLQLPALVTPPLKIPKLSSPAEGSRPMEFSVGIARDANEDSFLRLVWSPFKQELVGQNSLEGDELVVFDLAMGFEENKYKVFVDQFDLIRILNLNTSSVPVVDESQWSWKLRIGTSRIEENEEDYYDGVASFGAGRAWEFNEAVMGYGMVDLAAHTFPPFVRARPHLGLKFNLGNLRTWLYYGFESIDYDVSFRDVWGGKMQYHLNDRCAVHAEFSSEIATRETIGFSWYW